MIESMIEALLEALRSVAREPGQQFAAADARTFAPFLVTSVIIAAVIAVAVRSRAPLRALLSPRVWWHPSSRMDARLVLTNAFLTPLLIAPILLSAMAVAVFVFGRLTALLGPAGPSSLPSWAIVILYSVTLFVAWDGSRYLVHRLLHEVPALWELHKVHHSAERLTPLTVARVHPIESLLYSLRGVLVTGVLAGVFFYLFADRALQWTLLGTSGIGLMFNALGANLRHSHVWLSYGPAVERVLMSPAQHQLHHSIEPRDRGNYGSALSIWDWLGGSLRLAGRRRELEVGLPPDELNHDPHSAASAVTGPLVAVARRAVHRNRQLELAP